MFGNMGMGMGMNPMMMNNMGMNMMGNNMGMNPMMMNNMGMNMIGNNMGMNMMGNNMGMDMMGNMMMVNAGNEDWMKGFKMGMEEEKQEEDSGPKINIVFKTTQGTVTNLVVKHGTTVGQTLELYLKRVGKPELINNLQGRLCFLVNAKNLKFTDTTKIENFFKNVTLPTVLVNDVNNLIGA